MTPSAVAAIRVSLLALTVFPIVAWWGAERWNLYPRWLPPTRRGLVMTAMLAVGYIHLVWHLATNIPPGHDALAYWSVDLDALYGSVYGTASLFPYSPAAALLALPLGSLPQPVFLLFWLVAMLGITTWLTGRDAPIWLAFPPLAWLMVIGNIELLLAAAVVIGFRHPSVWAFVILTKVTPGIGLLWFAVRREWHALLLALGATAVIVAATWLLLPSQWSDWVRFLMAGQPHDGWLPMGLRLVAAALLVTWGALKDYRWTVLVAVLLAVPHFWFATLGGLVGLAALGYRWPRYSILDHGAGRSRN